MDENIINTTENEAEQYEPIPERVEVVGIRFKTSGKTYYFDPDGKKYTLGACAIVETARGLEFGDVSLSNCIVPGSEIVPPLRKAIRQATAEDVAHRAENLKKEEEAFGICVSRIEEHKLGMKLVDAEYTFDNSKLIFYFSADGRVDFRDLVKDLAATFHTRIELRQIGIRDEAKMIGGFGVCGRPFCCATFLPDFVQVSIKMAKEQNLSLNSSKISGACGRLMCCLRYEHEAYEDALKRMPKQNATVSTPDGEATVLELQPLAELVKVKMTEDETQIKVFTLEEIGAPGEIKRRARPRLTSVDERPEPRRERAPEKPEKSEQPEKPEKKEESPAEPVKNESQGEERRNSNRKRHKNYRGKGKGGNKNKSNKPSDK